MRGAGTTSGAPAAPTTTTYSAAPSVSPSMLPRGVDVPVTRSHIRAAAETYLARHPQERESLAGLTAVLDGPDDPSSRATLPGHVTCSAVVIDRHRRVLHIGHKATGLLLAPGGHGEADRSLLATALREVSEETGIRPGDLCLTPQFLGTPVDIDVHGIDADPSKGEPSHQPFDFRFAFYVSTEQLPPLRLQDEEVSGARWLAFADVRSPTLRAKLLDAEADGLDGQPEPVNASALVYDGYGRYLLHLRDMREGIWKPGVFALLGGGRESGDRCLEGTVRRELAEKAPGLGPVGLTPYAVEEATSVDGLAVPIKVYTARWNGHPDTVDLQEGVLLRWFTPDVLDRLRLSPGLGDLIRRHAAEHPPAGRPPSGPAAERPRQAAGAAMSTRSGVTVVAGVLALHYRILPTDVCEGPSGTATCNYVAQATDGRRWFVKAYPENTDLDAERRALELAEFAALGGVPVPGLRRTQGGDPLATDGGFSVSVTAFAEGAETADSGLYGERWASVGETVGRLHRTLARHPDGPPRRTPSREVCDVARGRQRLERLLARYAKQAPRSAFGAWARDTARERLDGLPAAASMLDALPSTLATQVVHGDLSSLNLMLENEKVAAVIDFRPPAHRSPMWELGRIVLDPRTVLSTPGWPTGLATAVAAYREANPAMPVKDLLTVPRVAAGYLACSVYPLSEPLDDPAAVTPQLEAYGRARHEALGVLCARMDEAEEVLRDLLR